MLERSAHLLEAVLFPLDRFDLDSDHRGVAQVRLWILKLLACESADNLVEYPHLLRLVVDEAGRSEADQAQELRLPLRRLKPRDGFGTKYRTSGGKSMEGHPHGAMRRKEREITDRAEIDTIRSWHQPMSCISPSPMATYRSSFPSSLPITGPCFHSASAGTKIEILKRNPKVCFEVSQYQGVIESEQACDFEARHRTVTRLFVLLTVAVRQFG